MKFIRPHKAIGFEPIFFGCDKDSVEISAINKSSQILRFSSAIGMRRGLLEKKLSDPGKTATQGYYFPLEANALVAAVEKFWGSCPTCRPDSDNRYGHSQCSPSSEVPVELGRVETNGITERNLVLAMFTRHFKMHSMMPDQNITYGSAEMIRSDCINKLNIWLRAQNYLRFRAYLFVN